MASLRKSERLISSRGHGCFTISPPQLPAAATRFTSHGSGRPGLDLRTATNCPARDLSLRPLWPLAHESDTLTTRPRALLLNEIDLSLLNFLVNFFIDRYYYVEWKWKIHLHVAMNNLPPTCLSFSSISLKFWSAPLFFALDPSGGLVVLCA